MVTIDPANAWRQESPGNEGWTRTAQPDDPNKYFILSVDTHAQEPADLWATRMDKAFRHRLGRQEVDENGVKWQISEGFRPIKIRDLILEGEDKERDGAGKTVEQRVIDMDRDGIDMELIFPNKGLSIYATSDPLFSQAMARTYNDWAHETYISSPEGHRMMPAAAVASGDLEGAVKEINRVAKMGFKAISIPNKPIWGSSDDDSLNYNLPAMDPLWQAAVDNDLAVTLHVSTGKSPRGARGNGGAIINYAVHALGQSIEPVVGLCASGVFERFPTMRVATIEAGIGWVPWAMTAMDEAHFKHHMWSFPKLSMKPSEYYRRNMFASFGEDPPGLHLVREFDLGDHFMWANDYPHHEGTWPHSAAAIERTMGHLNDEERGKILGLNALRFLKLDLPAKYQ